MYSLVSYEEDCVCLSLELPGVLVETECYGTEVIKTMISMQFPLFQGLHSHLLCWKQSSPNIMGQTELEALQVDSQSEELIGEEWNTTKEHADTIQAALQVYLNKKASLSQSFDYWNTYVSNQFSMHWRLDSLPQCHREGNFTAILIWKNKQLSMNLLFLQHYYQLKEKFLLLYGSYIHEWWICL